MGETNPKGSLRSRIAGKWQIPLLVVSTLFLARAVYRLRPPISQLPLPNSLRVLEDLVAAGIHDRAIGFAEKLLTRKDLTESDQATIRLQRARSRAASSRGGGSETAAIGDAITEDFQFARTHGKSLSADDFEHLGRTLERQGKIGAAVDAYAAAIDAGATSPLDLRRHVIELRRDLLHVPAAELRGELNGLLADIPGDRMDLASWVLATQLEVLDQQGLLDEASDFLQANRERFVGSGFADRFEYSEGLLCFKKGERDEAERRLRALRNHLDPNDEVDAMAGWLLGRVVLGDDGPQRPQEAASFFSGVISTHGRGPYVTASRIGLAEALAQLERHDEAIASSRLALEEMERGGNDTVMDRDVLRVSLGVSAESLSLAGRLEEASEYLPLAASLVHPGNEEQAALIQRQIAQIYALVAEQLDRKARGLDSEGEGAPTENRDSRALYVEAAEAFQKLAQLQKADEKLAGDASWKAADLYSRAGRYDRALEILDAFLVERSNHPFVPRALLRMGQIRQQMGELRRAVNSYQECYRRFPRTLEGARALVPMAQCYLVLEPNNIELVEKTLRIVLEESDVFTPSAPEFADALFLMGDAMWRQGEHERAITVLHEALDRYPKDPRNVRAKFLLADSYRQSALALKRGTDGLKSGFRDQDLRDEYAERFAKAREGLRDVINTLEAGSGEKLDRLDAVMLRHAYLYEGDCRFEVQDYREALQLYDVAVSQFKDCVSALSAYVQIIHCYVFLGEVQEARSALGRALVLVDALPSSAFDADLAPESREEWKRYLAWLGSSGLF